MIVFGKPTVPSKNWMLDNSVPIQVAHNPMLLIIKKPYRGHPTNPNSNPTLLQKNLIGDTLLTLTDQVKAGCCSMLSYLAHALHD